MNQPTPGCTIAVWFSCGAASAVAAKLTLDRWGDTCNVRIINNPVAEEDPDNRRFLVDVEKWLGVEIEIAINPKYPNASAVEVWEERRYMAGIHGAPCTNELKKRARQAWESLNLFNFALENWLVLGFTADEQSRYEQFVRTERPNLLPVLIDAGLTKADCFRIVQEAGIQLPRPYLKGLPNANCFTGETRFLTRQGVVSLASVVGQSVKVRSAGKGSPWRSASVKSFGVQPITELVLRRGAARKTVRTTANHRWFVGTRKHPKEVTTSELNVGDRLVSAHTRMHSRVMPSPWGIAQGITFGDGSLNGGSDGASARLALCGEKAKTLLKYFPLSPVRPHPAGVEVTGLPRSWKQPPDLLLDDGFLVGWLAGYFAADGCASKAGDYSISSAYKENLEFARDVAVRVGISVGQIRSIERQGLGEAPTSLYTLPLVGATLREDFFLNDEHRRRFVASNPREPHPWFVESICDTGVEEEVFCVVEPISKTFVLEDNILTGNCIGCVKATSPTYWNVVRREYPQQFAERAEQSRRLGVRLVEVKGQRIFLDELDPEAVGGKLKTFECGIFCEERL